ncbi:hypothetical protein ES332_A04G039100v1 [Gossypium tomentosum]|uniref:Uncharacterized protein n=1 Tax=Gossypium tomentosum TaxID=34277 RepID=A0A5D2QY52_GOSTO|nr:hypothetical protein ES332_A04G039100v1 [Gossypium tomentosum]
MAFCLLSSFPMCSFSIHSKLKSFSYNGSTFRNLTIFSALQSDVINKTSIEDDKKIRRSANYHRPIWDYDYVQSLRDDFVQDESYNERASKLQEEVRMMLGNMVDSLEKLELIDTLQKLGLSYHFQAEINNTLKNISTDRTGTVAWKKDNLYATALEFRLLRQHGYKVDQDVFTCFMDDVGNIKSGLNYFKGLLNLYEASYLLLEGETMLENAREMARLEARWFIDVYEKNKNKNLIILELAILDYNIFKINSYMLQHKWWKELGLGERLGFARDRLMSNFLWSAGMIITPQDRKSRRNQTKLNSLLISMDDLYDVYVTLDELELFTDVVKRWDINAIQRLPNYMKIYYHALYNFVNEKAFDTLKEQGIDVIPFIKKLTDLCKAYLLEAKWYCTGYTPTLQEYIDNAWISIAGIVMLGHPYLATDHITEDRLHNILECYPGIIYQASIIYKLKRGDVPKSILCYMNESGASEEEAHQMTISPLPRKFIEMAMNHARVSLMIYQKDDGFGIEDNEIKDKVLSLFVHPIFLPK